MREIILTDGQVAKVDDEDYSYLSQFTWHPFNISGNTYAVRYENGCPIFMHHEVIDAMNDSK